MIPRRRCTAIDALLLALALTASAVTPAAGAPIAGTVTRLSGALFAQGADGRAKALASGSRVAAGDVLVSGAEAYAQVTFADQGTLTLKPDTQVAVDDYAFDTARPADNRAEFTLVHGAVRMASGAIARLGSDRQQLRTPVGVIRGANATFVVEYAAAPVEKVAAREHAHLAAASTELTTGTLSDAQPLQIPAAFELPLRMAQASPAPPGARAPGLYVQVIDGMINLSNQGGSQSFTAGQFGFTASFKQPPVVLPSNPGLQFTPPPAFSSSTPSTGASGTGKSAAVDCEVR